ncbi:unnamed protein product [Blepharisma stoltei]|uniref:Uncharacterized protein n=1 Tax=Blepharisma stoltei TaxID=1481888 RepID=A0AAU9KDS7_9CILI|nr:unnamed protein product [Blepharisma stoltei]
MSRFLYSKSYFADLLTYSPFISIMHLFKKLLSKLKPSYLEFEEALPESPEEFKSAHHQIVLKEISKYEDVDLNNLSDSQIKKIAKEIAMIIATSLLKYPNTAECDTVGFNLKKSIAHFRKSSKKWLKISLSNLW